MKTRLLYLARGWLSVGLFYVLGSLASRNATPTLLHAGALDSLLPFSPPGVWLYCSFFVLVPLAYLCADARKLPWLTGAMQSCALICGLVFILWPTTLTTPAWQGEEPSAELLRLLTRIDTPHNCLPSLHGALTLLSVWALADTRRPLRSALYVTWGLGIGYGVLQIRRHLVIDLSAGLLVGFAAGLLTRHRWLTRGVAQQAALSS